jgi:hypothetical protein
VKEESSRCGTREADVLTGFHTTGRGAPDTSTREARAAELLRRPDADEMEVREALEALTDCDLHRHGLDAYYLNLLSIVGGTWTPEAVLAASRRCARARLFGGWECSAMLRRLRDQLADAPDSAVASARAAEATRIDGFKLPAEGIVFVAFHVDAFRLLPLELLLRGSRVVQPLDADSSQQIAYQLDQLHETVRRRMTIVNVERPDGGVRLMRSIARGDAMVAFLDGNTGADGPLGEQARCEITLLGMRLRVKNGIARLAGRLGRCLIPVHALRGQDGRIALETGPVLQPAGPLKGDALDAFADHATCAAYAHFESVVRTRLDAWESVRLLHRWRIMPEQPASLGAHDVHESLARFASGAAARFDLRRVAPVRDRETGRVWMDAHSLRAFRPPPWAFDLVTALASATGVCTEDISDANRDASLALLTTLVATRYLVIDDAPGQLGAARSDRPSGTASNRRPGTMRGTQYWPAR